MWFKKKWVLVLLLIIFLAGCGATKEVKIYQALNASVDTRNLILTAAGQAYKRGELTESEKVEIIYAGNLVGRMQAMAARKAKEWSMLNHLRTLNPDAVSKEEIAAAEQAYKRARDAQWQGWAALMKATRPYLSDWLKK